ncbi:MAG: hypothetical protein ABIQ96_10480 [Luteolibacter sp.]
MNKVKRWLDSDGEQIELNDEASRFHNLVYSDLNCKLIKIMKESGNSVRPNYTWAVLQSAHLAKTLGYKRFSVLEFGVAGGLGLTSLEETARRVEALLGIGIDVYGFDTGVGLPAAMDYRDMPNIYTVGTYQMDVEALRSRLKKAKLILGPISETMGGFLASNPAPVGFISVDVDIYTSSVDCLKVLEADESLLLPRVHCYFDDIMGASCADFLGERLAMNEFNETHKDAKISPIYGLWHYVPRKYSQDLWPHMMFMAHLLSHSRYCDDDGMVTQKSENLVPVS